MTHCRVAIPARDGRASLVDALPHAPLGLGEASAPTMIRQQVKAGLKRAVAQGVKLLDQQAIDTTTPMGKLVFQVTGASSFHLSSFAMRAPSQAPCGASSTGGKVEGASLSAWGAVDRFTGFLMARFGCVLDERSETRGQRPRYAQRPVFGPQVSPDPEQPVT